MDKNRHIASKVNQLLEMFPVVVIIGSRQCGKSTLVKQLKPDWKYYNFGILPVEIKLNTVIKQRELRGLKNFIDDMKCPYGFVINRGKRIEMLTDKIIQIPVHYL